MTSFVTTAFSGGTPRAVVLVLGFAGAKPKHVAKYASVYNSLKCSTVAGTASSMDIFTGNITNQDIFALDAVQQVAKVLKAVDNDNGNKESDPKIPVVMHILSNGGTFITNRIGLMLDSKKSGGKESVDEDIRLFGERLKLGCQIFDSAPGYFTTKASFNVIKSMISNKVIAYPTATMFVLFVKTLDTLSYLFGHPTAGEEFWSQLQKDTHCLRQAYIYSHDDEIVEGKMIEELAEDRKAISEYIVLKQFENSAHVQHLRHHETEYVSFIKATLKEMEEKNSH